MKTSSIVTAVLLGAVGGMAADMVLRPRQQQPKTSAGRAMQSVTQAVDKATDKAMQQMR